MTLTVDEVLARGFEPEPNDRIIFSVQDLYGVAESKKFPLNASESFDTGPLAMAQDPEMPATTNIGIVDFDALSMRVRYGVQVVFPGLQELVVSGQHDLSLLHPVRAIATDECKVTGDLSGWRALGCLEILQGSMWSGAKGG